MELREILVCVSLCPETWHTDIIKHFFVFFLKIF